MPIAAPFTWPIRVYYEDTDAGGIVYHASYLRFLERARTEWLRAHGISQGRMRETHGLIFTIVELGVRFHAPARLDDELSASCKLSRQRGASLNFAQELRRNSDQALLVTASVRAACLDAAQLKPRPIPTDLLSP
jgi:acyl-CoA thioester hydrolase